jgi:hypothetical protein
MRGLNILPLAAICSVIVSQGCSPRAGEDSAPQKTNAIHELHAEGENGTWLNYRRGDGFIIWHEASSGGGWINWVIEIPKSWELVSLKNEGRALNLTTLEHGEFRLSRERLMKFISITYEREGYEINSLWECYKVLATESLPNQASEK